MNIQAILSIPIHRQMYYSIPTAQPALPPHSVEQNSVSFELCDEILQMSGSTTYADVICTVSDSGERKQVYPDLRLRGNEATVSSYCVFTVVKYPKSSRVSSAHFVIKSYADYFWALSALHAPVGARLVDSKGELIVPSLVNVETDVSYILPIRTVSRIIKKCDESSEPQLWVSLEEYKTLPVHCFTIIQGKIIRVVPKPDLKPDESELDGVGVVPEGSSVSTPLFQGGGDKLKFDDDYRVLAYHHRDAVFVAWTTYFSLVEKLGYDVYYGADRVWPFSPIKEVRTRSLTYGSFTSSPTPCLPKVTRTVTLKAYADGTCNTDILFVHPTVKGDASHATIDGVKFSLQSRDWINPNSFLAHSSLTNGQSVTVVFEE